MKLKLYYLVLMLLLLSTTFDQKIAHSQAIHAGKGGVSISGQLLTKNVNVIEAIGDGYVFALSKDRKQLLGYSETLSGAVYNVNDYLRGGRWRIEGLPMNTEIVFVGFAKNVKRLAWIEKIRTTNSREMDLGQNWAYMFIPRTSPYEAGDNNALLPALQLLYTAGWISEFLEVRRHTEMVDELTTNLLNLINYQDFSFSPQNTKEFSKETGFFTDTRDGKKYNWVKIGNQIWMAENLNYVTHNGSWCYDKRQNNCNFYGRLYNWDTAQNVCPTGWHLPSNSEWQHLVEHLGGYKTAGGKLKEAGRFNWNFPNTGASNESGFSGLPGGFLHGDGHFSSKGLFGAWWSSTEAYSMSLYFNNSEAGNNTYHKHGGFSVRCVKD